MQEGGKWNLSKLNYSLLNHMNSVPSAVSVLSSVGGGGGGSHSYTYTVPLLWLFPSPLSLPILSRCLTHVCFGKCGKATHSEKGAVNERHIHEGW